MARKKSRIRRAARKAGMNVRGVKSLGILGGGGQAGLSPTKVKGINLASAARSSKGKRKGKNLLAIDDGSDKAVKSLRQVGSSGTKGIL